MNGITLMSDDALLRDANSAAAMFRAIGRLEGRFGMLEARQVSDSATYQRQLEAVAKSLDGLKKELHDDNVDDAKKEGKSSGAWHTLTIIGSAIGTLLAIGVSIWAVLSK